MDVCALIDCNNFYASCEKVFRPGLAGKAVVVLSNNDGCVVARSAGAKALGIPAGIPAFKIAGLIDSGRVLAFSSNYELYGDLSARVMETLTAFSPEIEVYSIDEAFLNLRGVRPGSLEPLGGSMRETVLRWTGLPISVGIAETKTLAKIANRLAKKSPKTGGVLDLTGSPHRSRALAVTDVGDVWGVGRRYARFLRRHGIASALDLAGAEDGWVRRHLTVMGLRTVRELRGEPCISLETAPPARKQVCVSRSFSHYITTRGEMEEAVATYTTRAAEKLRRERLAAALVLVFVMTNRFRDEPQYTRSTIVNLPVASDATDELIRYALRGVRHIFRDGYRFKKAGVVLGELCPAGSIQADLFDTVNRDAAAKVMRALDGVNRRMGAGTLRYAAEGIGRTWRMKRAYRSPRYTTQWDELPVAKAY